MIELNNKSELEFIKIDSEGYREYVYESGAKVRINQPLFLSVSESGGHRILDASGVSHYIPKGWIHLSWKAKEGQPHFVK